MTTVTLKAQSAQIDTSTGVRCLVIFADLTEAQMLEAVRQMRKTIPQHTWAKWVEQINQESGYVPNNVI